MRSKSGYKTNRAACLAVLFLSLPGLGFIGGANGRMHQGNRAYREHQYAKAREIYGNLAVERPHSPHVQHNLGLAEYQEKNWEAATAACQKGLDRAGDSGNKLKSGLAYNLGVTRYRQALSVQGDQAAERKTLLQASLAAFKRAIEADDRDLDAKFDYELVKRLLKRMEEEEQSGEKDNEQQNQDQDKQKDANTNPNEQEKDQNDPVPQQENAPGQESGALTRAQAEAILNQAKDLERFAVLAPVADQSVAKDW